MIKVVPKPMSEAFRTKYEAQVRAPGLRWLAENPLPEAKSGEPAPKPKRPPSLWLKVRDELADAFHERCAYTAMWLSHPGEVDHFISADEDRNQLYDWDNFRYCAGWLNSSKKNIRSTQILDPLAIEDDWFELMLPSLELRVTERCPVHLRERADFMLDRLKLRNGPEVRRFRQAMLQLYEREGQSVLPHLDEWAPLLARAIRKQLAAPPAQ
ncbi:MAG: hypothetical protein L6Q76_07795 [Polyangiaceae bacterium]|nr:hypothetical protein [Polyangiaceae bacterium]